MYHGIVPASSRDIPVVLAVCVAEIFVTGVRLYGILSPKIINCMSGTQLINISTRELDYRIETSIKVGPGFLFPRVAQKEVPQDVNCLYIVGPDKKFKDKHVPSECIGINMLNVNYVKIIQPLNLLLIYRAR